jgi:hypothetical protein
MDDTVTMMSQTNSVFDDDVTLGLREQCPHYEQVEAAEP